MNIGHISEMKVMLSAAGYYVGTEAVVDGMPMPYERISRYFSTVDQAQQELTYLTEREKE